jgi:predicted RNA binding protein YcfA (HicA-like mRNA interferase family)
VAALRRLGFVADPEPSGGSHLSMYRQRPDGTKDVTVVVLGKREIPRGTLRAILKLGKVSESDFLDALRKRRRR